MRYPTTRYGYHLELEYWMQGSSIKEIAKRLKRSERSVHDWVTGKRKVPWWVPEILRLQNMEWYDQMQQMGVQVPKRKFGIVAGDVIEFPKHTQVVKQLEASCVSTEQAEAHATALAQAMNIELVKKQT